MRENDEFIGQVEDYLVEFDGHTPLPGRVLDAIHAELPRTRQARARLGLMRMPPMLSTISSRVPLGMAAAAVVVALVLGVAFINRGNDQPAVGATPTASSTPVPGKSAPAESPASTSGLVTLPQAPQVPCPGITEQNMCLAPGTYQLGSTDLWPALVTLEVPANWWYYAGVTGQAGVLVQTEDIVNGSGWGVTFNTVASVSIDPCDSFASAFETDPQSPGEIYDVVAAWPGFEATEPVSISNGYNGVRFTLTSTKNGADCADSVMWITKSGSPIDAYPMVNEQGRPLAVDFQIFDIDGEPLVIAATDFPETSPWEEQHGHPYDPDAHAAHQDELNAIVDSIELKDPDGGGS